jgi:hypothetical protein
MTTPNLNFVPQKVETLFRSIFILHLCFTIVNTTFFNIFIVVLRYPKFHNGVVVKKEVFKI